MNSSYKLCRWWKHHSANGELVQSFWKTTSLCITMMEPEINQIAPSGSITVSIRFYEILSPNRTQSTFSWYSMMCICMHADCVFSTIHQNGTRCVAFVRHIRTVKTLYFSCALCSRASMGRFVAACTRMRLTSLLQWMRRLLCVRCYAHAYGVALVRIRIPLVCVAELICVNKCVSYAPLGSIYTNKLEHSHN